MKLSPIAQNPLEYLALKGGFVPTPLAYSHFGFMISKFLLEAVDKGVFEAIGQKKVSLNHIATECGLNEKALKSLLGVLISMDLMSVKNDRFFLTKQSKKWILKDSPQSLYWLMMFDNRVCLKWMDYTRTFLETGKGLQYHETLSDEEWLYYQKAMEAAAKVTSRESVGKIPVSSTAATMLDIGGSHGLYSVALCKKHRQLSSIILDLPPAVEKARDILQSYNMGEQVVHQAGNILRDDIGTDRYDNVLMASVAHHFTFEENLLVAQKVFRALKPGGYFTIIEVLRPGDIKPGNDMLSALGDFFFALSSTSGLWSLDEINHWQAKAGFKPSKKHRFVTIPGYVAVTGRK
jgi:SAM-dependent methyltransferase